MVRRFMALRIFWAWDLNRFGMGFWCDLCRGRFHSWPTAVGYWIVDFLLVQSTCSFFTSPLNWLEIHVNPLNPWYSLTKNDSDLPAQKSSPSGAQCVSQNGAETWRDPRQQKAVSALAFLRSEHTETGRGQRGQDAAQAVGLFFGMGTGGQTKGETIKGTLPSGPCKLT